MGATDLLQHLNTAGLSLQADGDRLTVTPRERLTDPLRDAIKAHKAELIAALAEPAGQPPTSTPTVDRYEDSDGEPWEGQELAPEDLKAARLVAQGLDGADAERLAAWMVLRDQSGDDRITCFECDHFRPRGKICTNYRRADAPRELGTDLATKPQRCGGYSQRAEIN